jgi:hypothetical protein
LLGSISGDLSVCKRLAALHSDDLARILKARMVKGQIFMDLPSVMNLAKSELKLRSVQLDSASHVLWILNLFRDLFEGKRINYDLASIKETAEKCMCDGVWVKQMDPIPMLKSVAFCGFAWDNYYITVLSKSGGDSGGVSGSGSGQSAQTMSRPSAASEGTGRTADRHLASGGVAARQHFDPFVSIPNQCMVDRYDGNKKWCKGPNQ